MSRRRYISTDISKDSRVAQLAAECGDFAALLYTWMLPHADDDCSVESDHDQLAALIVPFWLKRKRFDVRAHVDRAIDGMLRLKLLLQEGQHYYFPPGAFYKYQTYVKPERRRISTQNPEVPRKTRNGAEEQVADPPQIQNVEIPGNAAKSEKNPASVSFSSSVSSGSAIADPPPKRARLRELTEGDVAELADHFPRLDVLREAAKYRDWVKAKGIRRHDHVAGFRNWLRKAEDDAKTRETARPANGVYRGGSSPAERARARA